MSQSRTLYTISLPKTIEVEKMRWDAQSPREAWHGTSKVNKAIEAKLETIEHTELIAPDEKRMVSQLNR